MLNETNTMDLGGHFLVEETEAHITILRLLLLLLLLLLLGSGGGGGGSSGSWSSGNSELGRILQVLLDLRRRKNNKKRVNNSVLGLFFIS
jgi:hypothetical protein